MTPENRNLILAVALSMAVLFGWQILVIQPEIEKEQAQQALIAEQQAAKREAEARERLAQAEAKATEMVSKSIQDGDGRAINYFVATKYVDALGKLAESNNNKVMMIPLEASSVIGSIAGISDLVKDMSKNDKSS